MSRPIFTYPGLTMGIIGLLLVLYGWPTFNSGGALISQTLSTNSNAQSIMSQCAFSNTILTLSASVISAFLYHTPT
jgi:ammonia channel protein AmtB